MSYRIYSMSNCSIIRKIAPLLWEREESQNRQGAPSFPVLEICNYSFHILREWNYPRNFGQYWRLYWNQANGAKIIFQNIVYPLTSRDVFLIPSHIATSTELDRVVPHFSVNFKIGAQFDNVRRRIYTFPPAFLRSELAHFLSLSDETSRLMAIQGIVSHYLSLISPEDFLNSARDNLDPRIAKAVAIMESELDSPPTNSELCRRVNMSRNSFYRLFMRETKKTPNFFLFELRMLRASWLLHHTEKTMHEIAQETGYADRYHFSKAFKNFSGVPPVHYRRERQGT